MFYVLVCNQKVPKSLCSYLYFEGYLKVPIFSEVNKELSVRFWLKVYACLKLQTRNPGSGFKKVMDTGYTYYKSLSYVCVGFNKSQHHFTPIKTLPSKSNKTTPVPF